MGFVEGIARDQANLLPPCVDDYVEPDTLVRIVDAFVDSLDLIELGFTRAPLRPRPADPAIIPAICSGSIYLGLSQSGPIIAASGARLQAGP